MHVAGEDWVQRSAFSLALVSEGIAVILIGFAVVFAAWRTLRSAGARGAQHPWSDVRLDLGRSLALALEFLLAADIVRTAVAPTWSDISRLAAIAVIRTGLNYFLQRDIEETRRSEEAAAAEDSQARSPAPSGIRRTA